MIHKLSKTLKFLLSNPIYIVLGVITFLIALRFSSPASDTYWDLRAGQDILHLRGVWTDHYSYTINGRYWPNHEWLYQAALYLLYKISGSTMILPQIATSLVASITFLLFIPSRKTFDRYGRRVRPTDLALIIPITGVIVYYWASIRPETVSLALLGVLFIFLRNEKYKYIPLYILLWANIHAEFFLGMIAIGLTLLMATLINRVNPSEAHNCRVNILIRTFGLSLIASFCQPLTYKIWPYILSTSNKLHSGIGEFQPILGNTIFTGIVLVLFIFAFVFIYKNVKIKGDYDWSLLVYLLPSFIFLAMAINANRAVPIFTAGIFPFYILAVSSRKDIRPRWLSIQIGELYKRRGVKLSFIGLALAGALAIGIVQEGKSFHIYHKPITPHDIAAFNSCKGNEFNDYWSGGFLIWFDPARKVFQDNRYDPYPQKIKNMISLSPQSHWQTVFHQYHIQCAFLSDNGLDEEVLQQAHWHLTYSDNYRGWYELVSPAYAKKHPQKLITIDSQ
jgi:hypothetical protein